MMIVRGVVIAAPTGKLDASVRTQLLRVGRTSRRRAGDRPAVQPGLERRAALARRHDDVVDERAEPLGAPVAGVGDRDLDLLSRIPAEVDRPLLPAVRAAAGRVPRTARALARAGRRRSASGSGPARGAARSIPPDSCRRYSWTCGRSRPATWSSHPGLRCGPRRRRSPSWPRCRRTSRTTSSRHPRVPRWCGSVACTSRPRSASTCTGCRYGAHTARRACPIVPTASSRTA